MVLDCVGRQHHLVPMRCHEVAQHKIVTVVSTDSGEAPCPIQAVAAHNHGGPESEGHTLQHLCHQHTRRHLHRHTDCFEAGPEASVFPCRSRQCHTPVKTRHQA